MTDTLLPLWTALGGGLIGLAGSALTLYVGGKRDVQRETRAAAADRKRISRDAALAARDSADVLTRRLAAGADPIVTDASSGGAETANIDAWIDTVIAPDLRKYGSLIAEAAVRERIEEVSALLSGRSSVEQFAGIRERMVIWNLSHHAWNSLSAHLRDDPLPPEPDWLTGYRGAIADYEDAMQTE